MSSLVAGRIGLGAFWQSSILPPAWSLSMHSRDAWSGLGFGAVWAYAVPVGTTTAAAITTAKSALRMFCFLSAGDDEGEDEPEEGEGLGEGDAQEHRRAGHAGRLGLTGHGRDGIAHDDADADARPDGGAAVDDPTPDGGEPFGQLAGVLGCE